MALLKFKESRVKVEKQLERSIKPLRSDRGGEYLSTKFKGYLTENGIISQLTTPGIPQKNALAERRNQVLLDMVRSMLSSSELPIFLWGYDLETTMYTLNLIPSKSVPKMPLEVWTWRKHSLQHLHIWGRPARAER